MKTRMILALVALVLGIGSTSWGASTAGQCLPYNKSEPLRDPGDAFPWGSELPFPWRGIQGTWQTNIGGCVSYFSFKPKTAAGVKQLKVTQYDPITCQIVSEGVGFESDRVVKAVMNDKRGKTFRLTIHVFSPADVRDGNGLKYAYRNVTVMNMGPLGATEDERTSHELEKLSTDPKEICE